MEADDPIATPSFGDEFDIPADDPEYNTCIVNKNQDPSGAASSVSETPSSTYFSDGSKTKEEPQESISLHDSSLHSMDNIHSQKHKNGQKKMSDDDKDDPKNHDETKGNGVMYKQEEQRLLLQPLTLLQKKH